MSWTLSVDRPWMSASAVTGTMPALATLIFSPIQLREGVQHGNVTVSSPGMGSVTVPVTATAVNQRLFCDVNDDGATNAQDVAAVQARVGSVFGGPNYIPGADLDRDGAINAADVAMARTCEARWPHQAYLPIAGR